MNKNILILIVGLLILSACSENERMLYERESSIYLNDYTDTKDSLSISLATKEIGVDTVFIKVRLLGQSLNKPTKFGLEIIEKLTTAEKDVHYKPLKDFYLFPPKVFECEVPVLIVKGDDKLKKDKVTLALKLKANELETAYVDKQYVRIIFADMFLPPVGMDTYGNMKYFIKLFGVYSQKKHQMIFEYLGEDLPTKKYGMYYKNRDAKWKECSQSLSDYCKNNNVVDENGIKIEPWK